MEGQDVVIHVDRVGKTFKLPHDKQTSIKGGLISLLKGGKRTYETQQVLKNISFDIKRGEFVGIVGRNGSGKSTLLKLLAGTYVPTTGTVQVYGTLTPFIELGVGFNPELTGRENIFLNGALLGFSRTEMDNMYDDIVAFAELERFMDQKLKNYSSGMQVRLAFSIAIRAQGDILLLDEVLAVGDAAFQQKCYDYFEELKRQKRTVVFVSHDMVAVNRFCTRAIYIKKGKIIYDGSTHGAANLYAADNQQPPQDPSTEEKIDKHAVSAVLKRLDRQSDTYELTVSFDGSAKASMYVGLSVFNNGASVSEITTDPKRPLHGKGRVILRFDTKTFNAGQYHIGAALFEAETRRLLAIYDKLEDFEVEGADITRGAAVRLNSTWDYGDE